MLPLHGDGLVSTAAALVWGGILLAAYGASRVAGAGRTTAMIAALCLGFVPSVANFMSSAYVDNTLLFFGLVAGVFVGRAALDPRPADLILAGTALAGALSVKLSALPFLAAGGLVLGHALFRGARGPLRSTLVRLLAGLLPLALALPGFVRAGLEQGSPLYPFTLSILGRTLIPGNPDLHRVLTQVPPEWDSLPLFLRTLFVPGTELTHLNWGPGAVLALLAGLAGLVRLAVRPGRRGLAAYLAVGSGLMLLELMGPEMIAQRTLWATSIGRFLTPVFAAGVVATAALPARWRPGPILALTTISSLVLCLPRGWIPILRHHVIVLALTLLAATFLVWLVHRGARGSRRLPRVAAALVFALLGVSLVTHGVQRKSRARIYAAVLPPNPVFDVGPLHPPFAAAWPIWNLLDQEPPARVAASAGWVPLPDNWYRYPLLGWKLHHHVVYLPLTRDGSIVSYRDPVALARVADRRRWLERLLAAEIDLLVTLPPAPLEDAWARNAPEFFLPLAAGVDGAARAYRVDREAIKSGLQNPTP
jgi:hypothetical protein